MNVSLVCATHLHFACYSFLSFSFLLPLLPFHLLFHFFCLRAHRFHFFIPFVLPLYILVGC